MTNKLRAELRQAKAVERRGLWDRLDRDLHETIAEKAARTKYVPSRTKIVTKKEGADDGTDSS